jgi:hypothetical protein
VANLEDRRADQQDEADRKKKCGKRPDPRYEILDATGVMQDEIKGESSQNEIDPDSC